MCLQARNSERSRTFSVLLFISISISYCRLSCAPCSPSCSDFVPILYTVAFGHDTRRGFHHWHKIRWWRHASSKARYFKPRWMDNLNVPNFLSPLTFQHHRFLFDSVLDCLLIVYPVGPRNSCVLVISTVLTSTIPRFKCYSFTQGFTFNWQNESESISCPSLMPACSNDGITFR
jgi:hypothetical protein